MAALPEIYLEILKEELRTNFVPHLPPLLILNKPANEQTAKQLSRAFSAFALHKHLDISARIAAQSVVDDFNDNGIDAIFNDTKRDTLFLVQSKLKATEEFVQADGQAFAAGIRELVRQDFSKFNTNVLQRQAELESALGTCSHIKLLVAYTGSGISKHASDAVNSLFADADIDEERLAPPFEIFGPETIVKALLDQQTYQPINVEIQMSHCGKLTQPRTTFFGVVKMLDLVELHQTHGKALYEKNIRYFLGSRGASNVNRDIQGTLKVDPGSFFYLNNGVTALCSSIKPKGTKSQTNTKKLKVLGLSIINGAQTVASAAEVVAEGSAPDISSAKVLLTLIEANPGGDFGPRVTRARNNQNPVVTANFASLDPQQERLREELAFFGIQYHYRPEAIAISDGRNIRLQDALVALSWLQPDPRFAVWLKTSPGSINDASSPNYQVLFNPSLTGSKLANAVFYAHSIQQLIRSAEWSTTGVDRLTCRHGVHAIGSVLAKRLINKIDSVHIVGEDEVKQQISAPLDELRQQSIDLFKALSRFRGPLSFFKSQTETVPYLVGLMELNFGLAQHPALPSLKQKQTSETFPQERLFRFLSQHAPQV